MFGGGYTLQEHYLFFRTIQVRLCKDVSGNIIACINGKQPTAYGFKWKYKYDKN